MTSVNARLQDAVQNEIEDLHRFFVGWFNGTVDAPVFDAVFVPRMAPGMLFISPDGHRLERDALVEMLRAAGGTNPEFRIAVRDVRILLETGEHLVVSYTEWQKGAQTSSRSENGRVTTALLKQNNGALGGGTSGSPDFIWHHVHETWLPDAEQAAGRYDF